MTKTHSLQSQKIWKLPAKLLNLLSPWNPQNYRPRVNYPCRRFLHSLPVFVQTSHTASPKPHQLSREIRCSMVCRKAKMFHDQFYKLLLSQTFLSVTSVSWWRAFSRSRSKFVRVDNLRAWNKLEFFSLKNKPATGFGNGFLNRPQKKRNVLFGCRYTCVWQCPREFCS